MSWNSVTLPKAVGGLSIKTSILRNKALLAKCLWDIRTHPESFHALIFKKKYSYMTLPPNELPPLRLVSVEPKPFVIKVQDG